MIKKHFLTILLVILVLGILVVCGGNYEKSSVAFAQGSFQPVAYVPINITNTQGEATPNPFQMMVTINSAEYATYEASDLSNVAFTYPNGTVIPSWLESGNSNSSTDTVYWLKVGSIPAASSVTINMTFYPTTDNVLNNETTGEAPSLSPTYGEYDDGANVFIIYGDFNNSLSGWQADVYQGNFLPVPSPNGVEMLNGGYSENTYLVAPVELPSIPTEVEEAWDYNGGADRHTTSMFGESPFGSSTALILYPNVGVVLNYSICVSFWYYDMSSSLWEFITDSQVSSSPFTGGGNFNVVSFLTVNGTWASAGYAIKDVSLENFSSADALIPTYLSGQVPNPFNNHAMIISAGDGGVSSVQYLRWVVGRAIPPNGVAPSIAVGSVVVPEFPSIIILPLFMTATLLAVIVYRRKHPFAHYVKTAQRFSGTRDYFLT